MRQPRIVISGLAGGSGKTLLSLGLTRAFVRRGLSVQPCKKGPDYIDAAWLSLAAGRPCANLDPYFLPPDRLRAQFLRACRPPADLAVIEGSRGLYDGRDVHGSCSTAQVADILSAPVILVLNCAKMTRTAAALVGGAAAFDPRLRLAGVIVNNTGSERHADQVRQALETYTDLPVLGALARLPENPLPERHMGLALSHAAPEREEALDRLAGYAARHVDLEKVLRLARSAPETEEADVREEEEAAGTRPRIGFVRDDALWFYYGENLEALRRAGADLAELSLLDPAPWPELDGLYLGGGFPEAHAAVLAASPHMADIRALSEAGRPVYAECGGLMVLGRALAVPAGREVVWHAMAGLLPVRTRFFPRPQGLGYVEATVLAPNPFHPVGSVWRGHEFHYSRCEAPVSGQNFLLRLSPGTGMARSPDGSGLDGLCVRRTFASYTHLFAPAVPHWAENFVRAAKTDAGRVA
jgi:cobyrinic acid a,c-diamide synthase